MFQTSISKRVKSLFEAGRIDAFDVETALVRGWITTEEKTALVGS